LDLSFSVSVKIRQLSISKAPCSTGRMRTKNCDIGVWMVLLPVRGRMWVVHRFFNHNHAPILCEARKEMLGPLVDKIPT
jgi:hypothetical protein